jgi:predicted dehydrogenase
MEAIDSAGVAQVRYVSDASGTTAAAAASAVGAAVVEPDDLLDNLELDGVVIATPSGLHQDQAARALDRGVAVFSQKPLTRDAVGAAEVVRRAREADVLLGVDMSYRHLAAVDALRETVASGQLGEIYAVDLVFHNAYGPDKAWARDRRLAGGGCLIDLGIHMVDLALLVLGWPGVESASSRLYSMGRPLEPDDDAVEDYAVGRLDLDTGATVTVACSWGLHAGRPSVIEATFHGTGGSAAFENVAGSFYDFRAVLRHGTDEQVIAEPPDDWGGRAAVEWASRLAKGDRFDSEIDRVVDVASALDRLYQS